MAVFEINGRTADTLEGAFAIVREEWSKAKEPDVKAQKAEALAKPTPLDVERAAAGVTADMSRPVAMPAAAASGTAEVPPA